MLGKLKQETRFHHSSANADRLSLLTTATDLDSYRSYLIRIYGFEAPVESAFLMTQGLADVIDLRARTKIRLLKHDLQSLGVVDTAHLPRCTVSPLRGVPEALGWMYAIDHNALVHGLVRRHVAQRLPFDQAQIALYLSAYEYESGARWSELGVALDRIGTAPQTVERIVAAANLAFRRQRHWYELALPPSVRVA